ncbi:MAG: C13 family peptidase [Xanthomonadaceae bacterium]|jgi:hypothetical protein|nr:C13 family peptidase [Xanthomonadaceae bacterium]
MEFARTLVDGLRLVALRRPSHRWRRIGPGEFWLAAVLLLAVNFVEAFLSVPGPRQFDLDALRGLSFYVLLALLVAWATCVALRRPALFWPFATLVLLAETLVGTAVLLLDNTLIDWLWPGRDPDQDQTALLLWLAWTLLAVRRLFDHLEPQRDWPQRSLAALLVTAAIALPAWFIERGSFFYPADWDAAPPEVADAPVLTIEPEDLMLAQPARLDAALAALEPQRPGVVDLYVISFGSDGSERVFRNETLYVRALFERRFGAGGRVLALSNDPDLAAVLPLAIRANLGAALRGVASKMDPAEDILLLFVTSHGSEAHELQVTLDPLPLAQVDPAWLAQALDDTGIQHRVVAVSACFSGGFLPALEDPRTLAFTAARADRPSFGCGPDSDITFFGRAWLTEALNETADFVDAFERAKVAIARREKAAGYDPSEPQVARSAAVEAHLARWREGITPGPAVPFDPEGLVAEAVR